MSGPQFFDDPRCLAPRRAERLALPGGGFVLRSPEPLQPYVRCIGDWIERWARETPDALAVAEPSGAGWRSLSWAALRERVGRIAQGLLDRELPTGKPIVVLSDNGLDHLLLLLAGLHIGRAVCTVSSAYCRLAGSDFTRIHGILRTLDPALVYASDVGVYGPPLRDAGLDALVVFSRGAVDHLRAIDFEALALADETPAVTQAFARVTPDTHAKYLLTSGSTGTPKVVINTHRMLCANQQMIAQAFRFLEGSKPVLLDWLPWSHTFGANHDLHMVLCHGGTLYIDDGRPVPGLIDKTVAHLREVEPTVYFNVPRGYEMLLPALEADDALARRFFGKLKMLFYAGASMPVPTWKRLEAVAARVRPEPLFMTTSWGSTETSPAATSAHWRLDRPGVIGLPLPGVELKFVPNSGKLEMRVKGDHVFPGYRDNEAATREAFDEDGFYRIGDAGFLADPADPSSGVIFDGRIAEDFKLTSGTWVSVGTVRLKVVAALAPLAQDVVLTGHDRSEVGALVFLNEAARAKAAEAPEAIRAQVQAALQRLKDDGSGSSQTPTRALLLPDAPSAAAGEITDKGYINQRLVLTRRAAEVEALYAPMPDARVIRP